MTIICVRSSGRNYVLDICPYVIKPRAVSGRQQKEYRVWYEMQAPPAGRLFSCVTRHISLPLRPLIFLSTSDS